MTRGEKRPRLLRIIHEALPHRWEVPLHAFLGSRKCVKASFGRSPGFRINLPATFPNSPRESFPRNVNSGMWRFVPGYSGDHRGGFAPPSLFMRTFPRN